MSAQPEALPMPEHVAEVMPGWCLCWAGSEPLAHVLARHPSVRIGTTLYAAAELRRLHAVNAQMLEALELARSEMIESGNWRAKDYKWPKACNRVDAAIAAAKERQL